MTATDLLAHLRAERADAEAHYKAVMVGATFSDAVNPHHPMHKAPCAALRAVCGLPPAPPPVDCDTDDIPF